MAHKIIPDTLIRFLSLWFSDSQFPRFCFTLVKEAGLFMVIKR